MALQRVAHAQLRVTDLEATLAFHKETFGLVEIGREEDRVFLGAGAGENFDISLQSGGSGLLSFAVAADNVDDLEKLSHDFGRHGVAYAWSTDPAPRVEKSLRFTLPAGHKMEIVTLKNTGQYQHPVHGSHVPSVGISVLDLDHLTIRAGTHVAATMHFLRDVLGYVSSDIAETPDGTTLATWMRVTDNHHDIGIFAGGPGETLDHVAWTLGGVDHIKRALDELARVGINVEAGPGRHNVGGNLYAYFRAPGGNRYELTAEMPRAAKSSVPAGRWSNVVDTFSAWGALPPESLRVGS